MRHLKVAAEYIGGDLVELKVLEQTHFGGEFSPNNPMSSVVSTWFRYKCPRTGYVMFIGGPIATIPVPRADAADFVVKPDALKEPWSRTIIPIKLWPIAKAAVEAYNELYED